MDPVASWVRSVSASRLAAGLIIGHAVLGLGYAWTIPIWEGNDEPQHFSFVRHVAEQRALPRPDRESSPSQLSWQYTQPPLYYVAAAPLIAWMDLPPEQLPERNPFGTWGDPEQGSRIFLPERHSGPLHERVDVAVLLVRSGSVLVGTIGVVILYLLAKALFPRRSNLVLTAVAISAFAPQTLFIGSIVSNDIAIVTLSTSVLWLAALVGLRPRLRLLGGLLLATFLGVLAKFNGLAMLPVAGASALWFGLYQLRSRYGLSRSQLAAALLGLVVGLMGLIVAVWTLTPLGDSFSERFGAPWEWLWRVVNAAAAPDIVQALSALGSYARWTFVSYVAAFGWANIVAADWVYWLFAVVVGLAGLGLVLWLRRERGALRAAGILIAVYLFSLLAIVSIRVVGGRELLGGRYLLPLTPAVAILAPYALGSIRGVTARTLALAGTSVTFMLLALLTPFRYIGPAYAEPPRVSLAEVERDALSVEASFGGAFKLLGYRATPDTLFPGRAVTIDLYFQSVRRLNRNYTMTLQLLGPDLEVYAVRNTHPGHGNYPTSLWEPGEIFQDTYQLSLNSDFPAPSYAQIKVSFVDLPTGQHLPVRDGRGVALGEQVIFGRLRVANPDAIELPPDAVPVDYRVGDFAALVAYSIQPPAQRGEPWKLALFWRADSGTTRDYTVFVHLMSEGGELLGQSDAQPRANSYPTSLWRPGELVEDVHALAVPEALLTGHLEIRLGMYLLETLQRLSLVDGAGRLLPNDEIVLAVPSPG